MTGARVTLNRLNLCLHDLITRAETARDLADEAYRDGVNRDPAEVVNLITTARELAASVKTLLDTIIRLEDGEIK